MIIMDFSPIVIGGYHQSAKELVDCSIDLVRHITLNSIRAHTAKHKARYGETVLAIDSNSWRKDFFPYYKANRKKDRADDGMDWKKLFEFSDQILTEITDIFPGRIIKVEKAEADDIAGVLVKEFYQREEIMLIASDNDWAQLLRYPGVRQYSPILKKEITKDPHKLLVEKLIKGDSGDGIPGVRGRDDTFVSGNKQKPIMAAQLESAYQAQDLESFVRINWGEEGVRNYHRNRKLIDFEHVPRDIKQAILDKYETTPGDGGFKRNKFLNYLVQNRMAMLAESIGDF